MVISKKYCSYIPALIKALEMISGDVLELGAGLQSTFLLHWMCNFQGRNLVTYESSVRYFNLVKLCQSEFHDVIFVEDCDEIHI